MSALLTAFGIDWHLLVAQTINFAIVLAGLTYFLYRPVMRMIREREEKIAQGVKDAEKAAEARAQIDAERGAVIAKAERDAENVVSRAGEEGKRKREQIVKAAQVRADEMRKDAEAQAAELKRQALKESEQEIARTAVLAAEKILAKH